MPLGVHPAPVDRVGQHVVDLHQLRGAQRVVGLQPGQVDDLGDQIGEPGRLDAHPGGEPADGRRVVGRLLHRLGEQRQRPDRRLELVTDVGHEVPAGLLDPAGRGLVLGQQQHLLVGQRRDPDVEVRGRVARPRELEVAGSGCVAPATDLADQLEDRGDGHPAAAHHARGSARRLVDLQHLVVRPDDRAGGPERLQHLRDARRARRARRHLDRGRSAGRGAATQQQPGHDEADHDAQQPSEHRKTTSSHQDIGSRPRSTDRDRPRARAGGSAFRRCSPDVHVSLFCG